MNHVSDQRGFSLRKLRFLQEIIIVGLGYFVYSQIRGLAADRVIDAFSNGHHIVQIERSLGIFKELALQTWILPHGALVTVFNIIYFYGLFPLLVPTSIFLFIKRPKVYNLTRNAFLASGGIAVVFFLLVPTAPPRLLDVGLIDTLSTLSHGLAPSYSSIPGVNHYAALPSMHVGWNFLTCYALYRAFESKPWSKLLLLFPFVMLTATVVTGNHYIIDGLMGMLVAGIGLLIAFGIRSLQERRASSKDVALAQAPSEA